MNNTLLNETFKAKQEHLAAPPHARTLRLLDVVADAELDDELAVLVDVVLLDAGEETTMLCAANRRTSPS